MKPPTSALLVTELYAFTRTAVADYPFPDPSGKMADCRVFLHGLPDGQDVDTWPFVIVRWLEGEISSEPDAETLCHDTTLLLLGVNSPKSQAEAGILCAELLDCLRYSLWQKRILASRFELQEPLRSSFPEPGRQQHRFHIATIETVWNYAWPPKALNEAGISQLQGGNIEAAAYSAGELEKAWAKARKI